MQLTLDHNGRTYRIDTSAGIDISLGIKRHGDGVNCFYTSRPEYKPYAAGSFVGSVVAGGSCNVDVISFTPHGNGTHTECMGHISDSGQLITETLTDSHLLCTVVSVMPESIETDKVITRDAIDSVLTGIGTQALAVRTLPNDPAKKQMDYSGTNPVYFTPEALLSLRQAGIRHLLCDFPSVDREDDGGKLLAHKAFFGDPEAEGRVATITELIYIPDTVPDGLYLLNLQIAGFESDASPSRPVLYPLIS